MIVAVLALDQVMGYELMIPGLVFGVANAAAAERAAVSGEDAPECPPEYEVRVCGQRAFISTVADLGQVEIRTPYGLDALTNADLVIVPGTHRFLEPPEPQAVSAIRAAAGNGARVASMCVGAFTLAATGLLDHRRATTHWQWADEFAARYPAVDVDANVLFVDEGPVLTSAGVASGLDLCLHLIRQHAGADLAARTARRVVIPAWRDGGQAQYIEHASPADPNHPLQPTITWMEENALSPLDLHAIATHATVSVRTLNRQFRDHFGTTPLALLTRMRVDRARRLLESTGMTVDRVADQSGFGSYASLRYHFQRAVGVSPQTYRQSYAARH
ncbi:helix-turn-helix domain-containing protein [Mycobacterium sp. DL99]|uniref:GlxA family transcriptional regulator n=1 Tax=Mycobacterium sp. DL99 TaxID=2528957 RepID=UPI00108048E7|nr:helix-turn-helix domain-containing protein [Mycobacterium sp. DL99]